MAVGQAPTEKLKYVRVWPMGDYVAAPSVWSRDQKKFPPKELGRSQALQAGMTKAKAIQARSHVQRPNSIR